jgi:hypothetical protein
MSRPVARESALTLAVVHNLNKKQQTLFLSQHGQWQTDTALVFSIWHVRRPSLHFLGSISWIPGLLLKIIFIGLLATRCLRLKIYLYQGSMLASQKSSLLGLIEAPNACFSKNIFIGDQGFLLENHL